MSMDLFRLDGKVAVVVGGVRHLGLDWRTDKQSDKQPLEAGRNQVDSEGLRFLALDEIASKKGHR